MRVHLGSDHAGLDLKEHLLTWLREHDYEPVDHGPFVYDALDDYPVFCLRAAEAVAHDWSGDPPDSLGVVIGGSGNGEAIVANKVRGIRCGLCWNEQTARWSRQHNDANMLALGQRTIDEAMAFQIVRVWLEESFEGGRHLPRVQAIEPATRSK